MSAPTTNEACTRKGHANIIPNIEAMCLIAATTIPFMQLNILVQLRDSIVRD